MQKGSAMQRIGRRVQLVISVSSCAMHAKKVITAHVDTIGRTQHRRQPMHTEATITKCTNCGRTGVMRENGIPANWRLEHQDQLLCPVCWGPDECPPFDPLAEKVMVPSTWADKPRDPVLEELLRVHREGFGNGGPVA